MTRRPRQAVYRGGRWVTVDGRAVDQRAAQAAWDASRPQGRKGERPGEHSVVTLSSARQQRVQTELAKARAAAPKKPEPKPQYTTWQGKRFVKTKRGWVAAQPEGSFTAYRKGTVDTMEKRGEITHEKATEMRRQLGLDPAHPRDPTRNLQGQALGDVPAVMKLLGRTVGQIAQGFYYAPAGTKYVAEAVGHDVGRAVHKGDLSFKDTRRVGGAIGKGFVEDVKHPGANPGNLLMDLLGLASVGAGAASRTVAGLRAARDAGEVGRLQTVGRVAKAIARTPQPEPRTLRVGGLEAHPLASRNQAVAAVQRAFDRRLNRALAEDPTGRLAGYGHGRIARELADSRRVTAAVQGAQAGVLAKQGARLTNAQETALRVVLEGKPIDERIAFHEQQLAKASSPLRRHDHARQVRLLRAAAKYVEETPAGPALRQEFRKGLGRYRLRRGVGAAGLNALLEQVANASDTRAAILQRAGKLDPDQATARLSGPGRVIEGARYVNPTASRLGKPTEALLRQRKRVEVTQRAFDRVLAKQPTVRDQLGREAESAQRVVDRLDRQTLRAMAPTERARTVDEARALLDDLNAQYEDALRRMENELMSGAERRSEAATRNRENARRFTRGGKARGTGREHIAKPRRRILEDLRNAAEDLLHRALADPKVAADDLNRVVFDGAGVSVDSMRAVVEARDRLSAELGKLTDPEVVFGDAAAPAVDLGRVSEPGRGRLPEAGRVAEARARASELYAAAAEAPAGVRDLSSPSLEYAGAVGSEAKGRLAVMETAAARRVEPTGLVGSDFQGGRARVPYVPSWSARRSRVSGNASGVSEPRAPGSVRHAFRGGLLRSGGFRVRTTRLVADSLREAQAYLRVLDRHAEVRKAARATPLGPDWVAVRLEQFAEKGKAGDVSRARAVAKAREIHGRLEDLRANPGREAVDEVHRLADAVDELRSRLVIGGNRGESVELIKADPELRRLFEEGKIGWVPRRLLGDLGRPRVWAGAADHPSLRRTGQTVEAINQASKLAILYLKPAYAAPNVLGNASLVLLQQGFAAPRHLARSVLVSRRLSPRAATRLDAVMGEGFARALSTGGPGGRVVEGLANVWSKGVDVPFRRAAFLFEARRAGFKGWEGVERLLTDEAHAARLDEVARRANKELIDYARLGPVERDVVRHVVFFYPWVKGSARYAARFTVEHPVKAAVTAHVGDYGQERANRELGPHPSFMDGAFKTRWGVVNPQSAAVLGTPKELVDTVRGVAAGRVRASDRLSNLVTPAVRLPLAEIGRANPDTGVPFPASATAADIAKRTLVDSLPQATLLRRIREASGGVDQSKRLYPSSVGGAVRQFTLGGVAPRQVNEGVMRDQARAERRSTMTRQERRVDDRRQVLRDHTQYRWSLLNAAKQAGFLPADARELPKPLKDAITMRAKAKYADALAAPAKGSGHYNHVALTNEIHVLLKAKLITQAQAKKALAWADTATEHEIQGERRRVANYYFGGAVIADARAAFKERGIEVGLP